MNAKRLLILIIKASNRDPEVIILNIDLEYE